MEEGDAPMQKVKCCAANLYSRDVIAIAPLQYTETGIGTSLSYEHSLDHDGYLALYVPVIATFDLGHRNDYYNGYGNYHHNDMMMYAMPGIKFYPTGLGKVKYAIGPSVVVAYGEKTMDYVVDPYYYTTYPTYSSYAPYSTTETRFVFGMMINNSLNINATPRLYVGLEMGLGFSYIDNIGGFNRGASFLTQGSFKMGYRF